MTRYRSRSQLDDTILTDGDVGWFGFETRRNAKLLEPSIARIFTEYALR